MSYLVHFIIYTKIDLINNLHKDRPHYAYNKALNQRPRPCLNKLRS